MTRRVLVVSPAFHGYGVACAAALEYLGDDVAVHSYDAGGGFVASAMNAFAHRLPGGALGAAARRAATARAIEALRATRPEAVLVVKGDDLDDRWWDAVSAARIPVVVWLYDELSRMRYPIDALREATAVVSYSPRDVALLRTAGIDAGLLPDGYDSLTPFSPRPVDAVTFVGARYPERERVLRRIAAAGVGVQAYGREWSRHPWDVARTGRFRDPGVPAFRDLPRPEYYGVMAGSLATVNVHGAGHDGFSMRTFEAPGVGALALMDRPDVAQHYDVGSEVLVFTDDEELVSYARRARRDPSWARAIGAAGRRRTLAEHTLVHRMAEVQRRWA